MTLIPLISKCQESLALAEANGIRALSTSNILPILFSRKEAVVDHQA